MILGTLFFFWSCLWFSVDPSSSEVFGSKRRGRGGTFLICIWFHLLICLIVVTRMRCIQRSPLPWAFPWRDFIRACASGKPRGWVQFRQTEKISAEVTFAPSGYGTNILTDLIPGEERTFLVAFLEAQPGGRGERCMNSSMRVLRKVLSWTCDCSILWVPGSHRRPKLVKWGRKILGDERWSTESQQVVAWERIQSEWEQRLCNVRCGNLSWFILGSLVRLQRR